MQSWMAITGLCLAERKCIETIGGIYVRTVERKEEDRGWARTRTLIPAPFVLSQPKLSLAPWIG
jgi:hypothetical protein